MLARLCGLMLAMGALVLIAPTNASPVGHVAAQCVVEIDGVDDCFSPCMEVAGVYNTARREAGIEDKTPDAHCPA